jgi:hypothetical protein
MASIAPERNPSLYLLSDHLQAALTRGGELLAEELALGSPDAAGLRPWLRQTRELVGFVASVRTLEYAMTARLLQARKRAEDLKRSDSRLKPLIALFVAGMAPLADAAADLGDSKARDFDGADATLAFLRSRGLLAPDAAGLELVAQLGVDEDYLVVGRVRLGTLLDLVATFFDALDRLYDLAGNPAEGNEVAAARAPRMMGGAPAESAAGKDINRTLRA